MPRIARKNSKTCFCHVIVQGINKEYIFEKEKYKEILKKIIKEARKKTNVTIVELAKIFDISKKYCGKLYKRIKNGKENRPIFQKSNV